LLFLILAGSDSILFLEAGGEIFPVVISKILIFFTGIYVYIFALTVNDTTTTPAWAYAI
jgi:hypothetical protein